MCTTYIHFGSRLICLHEENVKTFMCLSNAQMHKIPEEAPVLVGMVVVVDMVGEGRGHVVVVV